jgi:regulator of sigma E protease
MGTPEVTDKIKVFPNSAAAESGMLTGDKILSVEGTPINDFEQLRNIIGDRAEKKTQITVQRADQQVAILVTPKKDPTEGKGRIGVQQLFRQVPLTVKQAAVLSLKYPPKVVGSLIEGLGRMASCKEKPDLSGPVGIVKEAAKAAEAGAGEYFFFFGALSAYLAGFNLIPFPALDGGRLLFLAYEAASRRKPNAKIEAYIHFAGLVFLLGLVALVTILKDVRPAP